MAPEARGVLPSADFQRFLDVLHLREYRIVGPTIGDGAVVWETIQQVSDLSVGWQEHQEPRRYR